MDTQNVFKEGFSAEESYSLNLKNISGFEEGVLKGKNIASAILENLSRREDDSHVAEKIFQDEDEGSTIGKNVDGIVGANHQGIIDIYERRNPIIDQHKPIQSEKYQRILSNIENKMYEPKVTQIMKYERVGYKQAKEIMKVLAVE